MNATVVCIVWVLTCFGRGYDVEGYRKGGACFDVLHVQLGPRVFPLHVLLPLKQETNFRETLQDWCL